jgi:hypothetical protein
VATSPGRILIVCAGIALGQAWAFADPQSGKPGADAKAAQAKPAIQKIAPGCAPAVTMLEQSFQALAGGGLRDAVVWVDDVDSGWRGSFRPFNVYVVTGKVYPPFQLKQGQLGRDAFAKLTNDSYNMERAGPLVITPEARAGSLRFMQDGRGFTLKVLGVKESTFARDSVTVQLCW